MKLKLKDFMEIYLHMVRKLTFLNKTIIFLMIKDRQQCLYFTVPFLYDIYN